MLWTILTVADRQLRDAREALVQLNALQALAHADRSWMLIHTASCAAIGAAAATLTGRIDIVNLWRDRWQSEIRRGTSTR